MLIVDDDFLLAQSLALSLETTAGVRTIVVQQSAAALRIATDPALFIDLLITDLHLPHLNGLQLIRAFRALPRYGSLPALMITASSFPQPTNGCTVGDPNVVIQKPFSFREVHRAIETLLP